VCAASQKKSLAGLDSTQTDGVCALGTLEETSNELSKLGLPEETSKDITRRLRAARHYLKTDYKIHVSRADRCADHCSVYAMSIADAEFHGKCAHDHLITCDGCEDLKNAIVDLQLSLSSSTINYSSSDVQEELQYDVDMAALKIEEWKAHVLRANHQDVAKSDIIDSLNVNQVFLIMDWAMKFLPSSFRETQRDWFGKKGKSWHVTVAITKDEKGEIETRTYIHVFNQCVQNWFAVASIVEDTMHTLRSTMPNLKSAFLRSDNAGCYHTAFLLLSLPGLGKRSGINILRYDFSDPQAGKDICDRRIATVKSHMRRYIKRHRHFNEGNDILSAEDMKMAIESYGGVKGCYAAVVQMDQTKQTMTAHTMPGIQALNNFHFESNGLRAWRAYNVGPGKLYSKAQLKGFGKLQGSTGIITIQPFGQPREQIGVFKSLATNTTRTPQVSQNQERLVEVPQADDSSDELFSCPEDGCIKTYLSFQSLQMHLDIGKHLVKLERESTYDMVKIKWTDTCREVSGSYIQKPLTSSSEQPEMTSQSDKPSANEGWALKKARKATRFSEKVRNFLKDIFLKGEETGIKSNPVDTASKIKSLRSENGKKVFGNDEWLSSDQVSRYFSRLSSINKSGRLAMDDAAARGEEQEDEDYVREAEEILTRKEIKRALEL
ncbi:hypothetical protein QZH41_011502, partial [Actinostola sp. cb2023]